MQDKALKYITLGLINVIAIFVLIVTVGASQYLSTLNIVLSYIFVAISFASLPLMLISHLFKINYYVVISEFCLYLPIACYTIYEIILSSVDIYEINKGWFNSNSIISIILVCVLSFGFALSLIGFIFKISERRTCDSRLIYFSGFIISSISYISLFILSLIARNTTYAIISFFFMAIFVLAAIIQFRCEDYSYYKMISKRGGFRAKTKTSVSYMYSPKALQQTETKEAFTSEFATKLRELNALRAEGIITEEEYEEKKREILAKI